MSKQSEPQYQQWVSSYILAQPSDPNILQRQRQPLHIASLEEPEVICGVALRVGTIEEGPSEFVYYRLKIRVTSTRVRKMLPTFFVLVDGCFYEYEYWQRLQLHQAQARDYA